MLLSFSSRPIGTSRFAAFCSFHLSVQRDGCPKIVNLGSAKTDLFYERKKYGFKRNT